MCNCSCGKFTEGKKELKKLMQNSSSGTENLDLLAAKLETISKNQTDKGSAKELLHEHYRSVASKCCFIVFAAAMGSYGLFLDTSGDSRQSFMEPLYDK